MQLSINSLVEQSICELSKDHEAKVRKFLARFFSIAILKNVSKNNLQLMMMYRTIFLEEIEGRFKCGDMQFLSNNIYGYIRALIKTVVANFQKKYICLKKTNIALM